MKPPPGPGDWLRRSRLAGGMALICGLAVAETVVAHHARPHPLSIWVWLVLGSASLGALLASLWFRRRWKQAQRAPEVTVAPPADAPAGTAAP